MHGHHASPALRGRYPPFPLHALNLPLLVGIGIAQHLARFDAAYPGRLVLTPPHRSGLAFLRDPFRALARLTVTGVRPFGGTLDRIGRNKGERDAAL